MFTRFNKTSLVVYDLPRSGRLRTVLTESNLEQIGNHFIETPPQSCSDGESILRISRRNICRGLKQIGLKCYCPMVQKMMETDYNKRIAFSNVFFYHIGAAPDSGKNAISAGELCKPILDTKLT